LVYDVGRRKEEMAVYGVRSKLMMGYFEVEADDVAVEDGTLNFWKYKKKGGEDTVTVFLIPLIQVEFVKREREN
jgi:hypothetical protein